MPDIRSATVSLLLLGAACTAPADVEPAERQQRTERDQWGLITCSEATETETCYTQRAIMGVSMGCLLYTSPSPRD